MSFTPYSSNQILDGNAIDHSALWVQVHTSSPGASGTANVAGASPTRVVGAFSASGNILSNTGQIDLASDGTGSSNVRFFTLWDAVSGGNCIYTNGNIVPVVTMTAGDEVAFLTGELTVELALAAS